MRGWLVAALLITPALLGCIGSDDDTLNETTTETPELPEQIPGVARFTANGTELPLPDASELAEPLYHLTGVQGAEPTMGITSQGNLFVATFETVQRSQDKGATWEQVYDFALEGAPVDPFFNADPMLWVDPITDIVYDAPMYPALACSSIIMSSDEGESWTERHGACPVIQPFDRQTLSSGPPGPDAPPVAGAAHPTVLYLCYNQLASTSCLMSYDGGLTWPANQPVWDSVTAPPGSEDCAGQNGHPMAAPDGTMVVPKSWFCEGLFLAVSTDSGLTWEVRTGPQVGGDTLSPEIAFTPDGTMYALWQGDDHRTYLARTTDVGQSWDGPWVVNPPGVGSTVFAAMAAGDDGRIAMGFLGTEDSTDYPPDVNETARWHLHVVTSEDAGSAEPTFTSYQVTPDEDPVQVGPIWIGGGGDPSRNLLDFIDGAMHPDGTFVVSYTEGCTDGCAGEPNATAEDSRDRQAAVGVLDGWSLLAP